MKNEKVSTDEELGWKFTQEGWEEFEKATREKKVDSYPSIHDYTRKI